MGQENPRYHNEYGGLRVPRFGLIGAAAVFVALAGGIILSFQGSENRDDDEEHCVILTEQDVVGTMTADGWEVEIKLPAGLVQDTPFDSICSD